MFGKVLEPSDDTDSEYSTLFNLTWNTQHGNSSGSSQFYSGEALTGETHVVNISASQLNAAISSNTSGRLFIHVKHGSTYDDDGYTGIGMDSQTARLEELLILIWSLINLDLP